MNQGGFMLLIGRLQPLQCLIVVFGMSKQSRNAHTRNIALPVSHGQHFRSRMHCSDVATFGISAHESVLYLMVSQYRKELLGFSLGVLQHSLLVVGSPKRHVRRGKIRFDRKSFMKLRNGLVIAL